MHPYYEQRERKNEELVECMGYACAALLLVSAGLAIAQWLWR